VQRNTIFNTTSCFLCNYILYLPFDHVGVLYKEMSKGKLVKKDENDEQEEAVFVPVKGLERLALLDRAEEALTEARNTRISLLGQS